MKRALLLLSLSLPASASAFHDRAPHAPPDRSAHNRTPASHEARSSGFWRSKGILPGRTGHRTTNK